MYVEDQNEAGVRDGTTLTVIHKCLIVVHQSVLPTELP